MIYKIEKLQPLYESEYVEGTSVIVLPVPYLIDPLYITTGNTVHIPSLKYLRIIDIDSTGIYEWYLYDKNMKYVTMYAVHHTIKKLPTMLICKHGMSEYMTDYGVLLEDNIPPVTSRHLIDYYLSTISDEVYSGLIDENDFGRDITSLPKYMCDRYITIPEIITEFNEGEKIYDHIIKWFDCISLYPYSLMSMQSLINKSVSTITHFAYKCRFNTLLNNLAKYLNTKTIKNKNILSNYLAEGYITPSELRKITNVNSTYLSRSNMCHNPINYRYKYIRNMETNINHELVKLLAISPVREFYFVLHSTGEISQLTINDVYGYPRYILTKYFDMLTTRLRKRYPFMNVQCVKTWDNQFIVIFGDEAVEIEVCDVTTSIMACSEFVHIS